MLIHLGYSLQAMNPNLSSIEIYADDASHHKRTHQPHVEVEYTTNIEVPIIPGFANSRPANAPVTSGITRKN